jgi:FkbM family methyltransferase
MDGSGMVEIPSGDSNRAQLLGDPLHGVVKHLKIIIRGEETIYDESDPCLIDTTGLDLSSFELPGRNDSWWPQLEAASPTQKLDIIHQNIRFMGGSIRDEYPEQLMVATFLQPDMKVLEIGSNIGRNTLTIASLLADQSNLVTLESDAETCRLLEVNRRANRYEFKIENAALSYRKLIQRGWNTIPSDEVLPGYKAVPTITFQELEAKHQIQFDTVVADCEGALYWILLDYPELFQHINLLMVENDYNDPVQKSTVDAIVRASGLKRIYSKPGPWGPSADCFYEVWRR